MLRLLVLLLVLANMCFYVWSQGTIDALTGIRSAPEREPERLLRQVMPESVRVLSQRAANLVTPEPPPLCLEAGPFTPAQSIAVEATLRNALPAGNWTHTVTDRAAVWLVYMGKFPNRNALRKKVAELKQNHIAVEEMNSPAEFSMGLSLGRYDEQEDAEKALSDLTRRGANGARVVMLSPLITTHMWRIDRADAATQDQLANLPSDALLGKSFAACQRRS